MLEEKLVAILTPILERAGATAAAAFQRTATNHLTAAAHRARDRDALLRAEPSQIDAGFFGVRIRPWTLTGGPLLAAAPSAHSTMVCVKPRPEEALAIADPDGEPAEILHVTLVSVGDYRGDLEDLAAPLRAVAESHAPLSGVVGGYGRFEPAGVGILLPDVPGLVELRVAVTEAYVEAGVSYARDHGYTAHVTVDCDPEAGEADEMLTRAKMPLHFDAILIVRGDRDVLEIPLVGRPPLTAAGDSATVARAQQKLAEEQNRLRDALDSGRADEIAAAKRSVDATKRSLHEAVVGPRWTPPAGDELLNADALVQTLRTKTDPIREAVVKSTMGASVGLIGREFDVTSPFIDKALATTGAKIKEIADTTRANVMRIVGASYREGLSIPDTAKAIESGMREAAPYRARMIARTELAGAVNSASLTGTQIVSDATGVEYVKKWMTAPGAKFPRHETYEGLDGQTAALDDVFQVGDAELQFPGDPDGDPAETINCRCTLVYDTPEGEQEADADTPPDLSAVESGAGDASAAADEAGADVATPEPAGPAALATHTPQLPPAGDTISTLGSEPIPQPMVARIQELGLDRPLDELTPTTSVGRQVFADAPAGLKTTEGLYKVNGEWTEDRAALHDRIVAAHFEGKAPSLPPGVRIRDLPEEQRPGAYFTAGGSASGKSAAAFRVGDENVVAFRPRDDTTSPFGTYLSERPDVVHIDPDMVKAMLPEYGTLRDSNDLYAASGVHEESSAIAKRIQAEAYERGYSVIVDTTGSSGTFVQKMQEAAATGRTVKTTMFSIPTNEAIVRAMARGDRSGRYVAIHPLKHAHMGASKQLAIWKNDPSIKEWTLFDNSEAPPRLVAEGGGGKVTVHDQAAFDRILAKADEGTLTPAASTMTVTPATATAKTVADFVPGAPANTVSRSAEQINYFAKVENPADPQAWIAEATSNLTAAVSDAVVQTRVTPEALQAILEDGRFKSQFESGTSRGMFNNEYRAQAERKMFGYPESLPPEQRPIYGYLSGSAKETGSIDQYGAIIVRMSDEARARTTFSLSDSLGAGARSDLAPSALSNPSLGSWADGMRVNFDTTDLEKMADGYAEAQIHGGLSVADIAEVVLQTKSEAEYVAWMAKDIDRLASEVAEEKAFIEKMLAEKGDETNIATHAALLERSTQRLASSRQELADTTARAAALRAKLDELGIPWREVPDFKPENLGG